MDAEDGAGASRSRSRARRRIERRLLEVHARLVAARAELEVLVHQADALRDQAEEMRIRVLVSETPGADREWREADGHARRLEERRAQKRAEIAQLVATQDDLLGQLVV